MNFQIETTSFCNLTCPECPNRWLQRPREFIRREVWETIMRLYVSRFQEHNAHLNPPTLIPTKDGEPLLNKRLPELLQSWSDAEPEMHLSLYTHGLLLKEAFIDFLRSLANPVRLLVTFHFFNADGSENDYRRTGELLRRIVRQPRKNVEFILASHLIPPMSSDRLQAWRDSWSEEINAGLVTVHANVNINPWTGLIDVPLRRFPGCPYEQFDTMFFGVTGNVIACCMDLEEEIVFGNVMTDDPEEMFEAVKDFYEAQLRHEMRYDVCSSCFGAARG